MRTHAPDRHSSVKGSCCLNLEDYFPVPEVGSPSLALSAVTDPDILLSHDSLVSDGDNWPRLSQNALYGMAGEIVRCIEPHSEADPAAILVQFLVAMGNIVGRGPYCTVEATRHYLNLATVLVGSTSKGRKGTSWNQV